MKLNNRLIIVLIVIIIGLIGCNIYLVMQNKSVNTNKESNEIVKEENNNSEEKYYDCSFTRTYRVVDLLDGYVAEVPEESYVVLDAFQSHSAFTHGISSELKKKLEVNKYYEFTYTLKGIGIVNDIEDVRNRVSAFNSMKSDNSLKVLLEIKETDRVGLGQLQEKICEGK